MNIWHDMDPKQITPTDFSVLIFCLKNKAK